MTDQKKAADTSGGQTGAVKCAFDVFLSHSSKDKPVVREIAERLKGDGCKVWFDEWCIRPGDSIFSKVEDGLKRSRVLVLCMSSAAFGSDWATLEHQTARFRDPINRERRFVPLRLDETPPEGTLEQFLYIDWRGEDKEAAYAELLRACRPPKPATGGEDAPPARVPLENLPYRPMGEALFKGRGDSMDALMRHFESGGPGVITQPQAIHGLGGIGKTRLAVEYAWKAWAAGRYDVMLFIAGETPDSLLARFAALSQPELLNLPAHTQSQDIQLAAVFRCLQERQDWLLIIDNIDSEALQAAVKEQLLPHLPGGRILITSRLRDWWDGIHDFRIDHLSEEDGAAYLLEKTAGKRHAAADDEAQARAVSRVLEGLPVALEQAGAYISRLGLSFAGFLKVYEEKKKAVLGWDAKAATNHPLPVLALWEATEAQLGLAERAVLRLLSFLAPAPVPIQAFDGSAWRLVLVTCRLISMETGESSIDEATEREPREVLGNLASWSMLHIRGENIEIHRLVQETTNIRLPDEMRPVWQQAIVDFLNIVLPDDRHQYALLGLDSIFENHLEAVLDKLAYVDTVKGVSRLLNLYGVYLLANARYDVGESALREGLLLAERRCGENSDEVASYLNNLASLLHKLSRFDEAEPLIRRSLKIQVGLYGKQSPKVSRVMGNLAQLLKSTGRNDEAKRLMIQALRIDEMNSGSNSLDVARDLNNMGAMLLAERDYSGSEAYLSRAEEIYLRNFGRNHSDVAMVLNNLASVKRDTEQFVEAERLLRQSIEIYEQVYGEAHPDLACALVNLAELLSQIGRVNEAIPLLQRSVSIDEKVYGQMRIEVSEDLTRLARILAQANRFLESESSFRQAIEKLEVCLGEYHPKVGELLNSLAQVMVDGNRLAEAEPIMRRSLSVARHCFGLEDSRSAIALSNLGQLLQALGRLDEAEPLLQKALDVDESKLDPGHPTLGFRLNNLALILRAKKLLREAEPLMRRALGILESSLGPNDPNTKTVRTNLDVLVKELGNPN